MRYQNQAHLQRLDPWLRAPEERNYDVRKFTKSLQRNSPTKLMEGGEPLTGTTKLKDAKEKFVGSLMFLKNGHLSMSR